MNPKLEVLDTVWMDNYGLMKVRGDIIPWVHQFIKSEWICFHLFLHRKYCRNGGHISWEYTSFLFSLLLGIFLQFMHSTKY